jgi:mono/diheme cytochrome c family protein
MRQKPEDSTEERTLVMITKISVTVAILLVACGSWVAAQNLTGNPGRGEILYQQHCLRCHGEQLDGNGPDGTYLIVPPANLRSMETRLKSDWELLITIAHGVLFSPMHGWRDRLSEQDIMDVLAYLRSVAPAGIIS